MGDLAASQSKSARARGATDSVPNRGVVRGSALLADTIDTVGLLSGHWRLAVVV